MSVIKHDNPIRTVGLCRKGRLLACNDVSGTINVITSFGICSSPFISLVCPQVWDITLKKIVHVFKVRKELSTTCLEFSADGQILAYGSVGRWANIWHLNSRLVPDLQCAVGIPYNGDWIHPIGTPRRPFFRTQNKYKRKVPETYRRQVFSSREVHKGKVRRVQ